MAESRAARDSGGQRAAAARGGPAPAGAAPLA